MSRTPSPVPAPRTHERRQRRTAVPLRESRLGVVSSSLLFRHPHGIATAATNAADDAICATDKTFLRVLLPSIGFSGTTTVSPGPRADESTLPDQKPPCFPLVTEPSERMIKIALLFPRAVAPPARERYQPAFLPGV